MWDWMVQSPTLNKERCSVWAIAICNSDGRKETATISVSEEALEDLSPEMSNDLVAIFENNRQQILEVAARKFRSMKKLNDGAIRLESRDFD